MRSFESRVKSSNALYSNFSISKGKGYLMSIETIHYDYNFLSRTKKKVLTENSDNDFVEGADESC